MPVTLNGNLVINLGHSVRGEQPVVHHPDKALPLDMLEGILPAEGEQCIPVFPVRYAVKPEQESGYGYDHPNLFQNFPDLEQTQYRLSPLREEPAYIYVYDESHEQQVYAFKYDPDSPQRPFYRLKVSKKRGSVSRIGAGKAYMALPYEEGATDKVQLLYTDTPLTVNKLQAFIDDSDGLRSRLAQTLDVEAWMAAFKDSPQPDAPQSPDSLTLLELETSWNAVQYPLASPGTGPDLSVTKAAMQSAANGNPWLAFALHDPIGIGGDLTLMLGEVMDSWQDYNAQAAHAMWTSDIVDTLIWAEHEHISSRAQHQAAPGISPQHYSDAMRQNIRNREVAEWEGWKNGILDENARSAFIAQYKENQQKAEQEIRLASEQAAAWWSYDATGNPQDFLDIYDENDVESYLAMRSAAARCIVGLSECQQGREALAEEMTEEGLTGRLERYFAGHPEASNFIADTGNAATATSSAMNAGSTAALDALFVAFPSDDGARIASIVMTSVAVEQGLINSSNPNIQSRLVRTAQFLEGKPVLNRISLGLDRALRKTMELAGVPEGRAQNARFLPKETRVQWIEEVPYRDIDKGRQHHQSLARLRYWNNIQIQFGGLGVLLNGFNIHQTMEHLSDSERSSVMKVMSVGTTGVGIAASIQQLRSYQLMGRAITAKAQNSQAAGSLFSESKAKALAALGLGALWSFGVSFSDYVGSDKYLSEKTRRLNKVGAKIQFSAGILGGAMYMAQKRRFNVIGPRMFNIGGWVIVGLMVAYAVFATWRDRRDRDDWMRAGYWGTEATLTPEEEQAAFYKRFYTPQITSEEGFLKSLVNSTFVPIRIDLPGYDPHLSQVRVERGGWFSTGESEVEIEDIVLDGETGIARVEVLRGTFNVEYWPDIVSQPDLKLTESISL